MPEVDNRTICFISQNPFGRYRLYPVGWMAETLCEMMETKTFLERNLKHLKTLGFTVLIDNECFDLNNYKENNNDGQRARS